jgi:hypothetical protein
MTVKQIAEAVGRDETNVQRWIKRILAEKTSVRNGVHLQNAGVTAALIESIRLKAGSKDPHHPADYTFEETVLIIEVGLGKSAAGVYRASAIREAELQNTLSVRAVNSANNGQNEILTQMLAFMQSVDKRLQNLEQKQLASPEVPDIEEIKRFANNFLDVTGRSNHFVLTSDAYELFIRENPIPMSKSIFVHQLCRIYPQITEMQRRRGERALVGCRPQERLIMPGKVFSSEDYYKAMLDD